MGDILKKISEDLEKKDPAGKLGHHNAADMTEAEFLDRYQQTDYPRPSVTADILYFSVKDGLLQVLLGQRAGHPFRHQWALPGGFLEVGDGTKENQGEHLDDCAYREGCEETSMPEGEPIFLEQLYTFGDANRDPRCRVVTVAFYCLLAPEMMALAAARNDLETVAWFTVDHGVRNLAKDRRGCRLAFDHDTILAMGIKRIRGRIDYDPRIAKSLVGDTFTVAELRSVYEAIKGQTYNPTTFRRRFKRMLNDGILVEAPGKRTTATKPAKVYSFGDLPNPGDLPALDEMLG